MSCSIIRGLRVELELWPKRECCYLGKRARMNAYSINVISLDTVLITCNSLLFLIIKAIIT